MPLINGSFGSSLSSNVDVDQNGYNGEKEVYLLGYINVCVIDTHIHNWRNYLVRVN